jgi:hypothetical protein
MARWAGRQKTAKRPETNEGGREEEERRPGIAARPLGARRLRSAKTVGGTGSGAALCLWSGADAKKFLGCVDMGGSGGGEVEISV